jgi:ubiquinone biosynthesis protein
VIPPKLLARLIHINWVLVVHGLDEVVLKTHLFRPVRYIAFLSPGFWLSKRSESRGIKIRKTLEALGPIFVKFGQALSTRKDLLPEDIADELVKLQDNVPPFANHLAIAVIEKSLEMTVSEAFAEFDEQPMASASVAQVHAAVLKSGEQVVVKVLRPDIEQRIHSDVGLLFELAKLAEKFWSEAKRLKPVEVVAEFEKTIIDELDLVREAANAAKLRRNFENSDILYVPKIYWPLTRQKVLVMERISGIPVGDIKQLADANIDFKLLAERGVEVFFTQVFRDNFFHADMHPGNIFVEAPAKYIAVDFGIVGSLSTSDQRYLAENFMAFFNRDYRRVAEMHVASGWVPSDTRVEEFESAIRTVCEPIFEKPLKEISFGLFLLRLFQTARRYHMEVQPQLVLLQKTLLNIEGLGRQLYPDLDLWQTAKPYMENWFKERLGPKARFDQVVKQLPQWSEQLPEMPNLVYRVMHDAANGNLQMQSHSQELKQLKRQVQLNQQRTVSAIFGASLIISATVSLGLNDLNLALWAGYPILSWVLGGLGLVCLIRAGS